MLNYRIFETLQFQKELKVIAKRSLPKIEEKLAEYVYPQLKREPHFGLNIKKLKAWNPGTWRYRIGDWRFFYEISNEEKIIFMTAISHKKGFLLVKILTKS